MIILLIFQNKQIKCGYVSTKAWCSFYLSSQKPKRERMGLAGYGDDNNHNLACLSGESQRAFPVSVALNYYISITLPPSLPHKPQPKGCSIFIWVGLS